MATERIQICPELAGLLKAWKAADADGHLALFVDIAKLLRAQPLLDAALGNLYLLIAFEEARYRDPIGRLTVLSTLVECAQKRIRDLGVDPDSKETLNDAQLAKELGEKYRAYIAACLHPQVAWHEQNLMALEVAERAEALGGCAPEDAANSAVFWAHMSVSATNSGSAMWKVKQTGDRVQTATNQCEQRWGEPATTCLKSALK